MGSLEVQLEKVKQKKMTPANKEMEALKKKILVSFCDINN